VYLVGFTIEIYYDARPYERPISHKYVWGEGGHDKHLFLMSELERGECFSLCRQLYSRRRLYECFCGVWNFCRCPEAKHFEHSYQKSQNKKFMLVYISEFCLYRACLWSCCVQVGPALCTYIYSQAKSRHVSLVATKPSSRKITPQTICGRCDVINFMLKEMRNTPICAWQDRQPSNSGAFGFVVLSSPMLVVAATETCRKLAWLCK